MIPRTTLLGFVLLSITVSGCRALPGGVRQPARQEMLRHDVQRALSATPAPAFVSQDREGRRRWQLTRAFYKNRNYELAWIDNKGRTLSQVDDLVDALTHAAREGLDPDLYNVPTLAARRAEARRGFLISKGLEERDAVAFDIWLTYVYIEYASDLVNGLSDLAHADPSWRIRGDPFEPVASLSEALEQNRVRESLTDLIPKMREYVDLREVLQRYRDIAAKGGWPMVPRNLRLKPGQRHPAVAVLARRLAITGDYSGQPGAETTLYSTDLQEAVRHFQKRQGLEPNGLIGAETVRALNVPVEARVKQIALNLERLRWLPRDLGDRHILVNIPEFHLEVWDRGTIALAMRVVVGRKDTPTPIFSDEMTYVVFAPYWNVPANIAEKETLPSVIRDPAFLDRTNMELIDSGGNVVDPATIDLDDPTAYRFRQRPGTSNSLGLVKFMFPNQYNVYLHDTPADSLFARATRSLSHGCVRVEQPEALARYVLADQPEWTAERIDEAMHGQNETVVKLRTPVPVYLGYWTTLVSSDGLVQFRPDIYEIDARQGAALSARLEKLKARATAAARAAYSGTKDTKLALDTCASACADEARGRDGQRADQPAGTQPSDRPAPRAGTASR